MCDLFCLWSIQHLFLRLHTRWEDNTCFCACNTEMCSLILIIPDTFPNCTRFFSRFTGVSIADKKRGVMAFGRKPTYHHALDSIFRASLPIVFSEHPMCRRYSLLSAKAQQPPEREPSTHFSGNAYPNQASQAAHSLKPSDLPSP